jgi:hypothetical protein
VLLDDYMSSLRPGMVEGLVCGASYIKGAHRYLNVWYVFYLFSYMFSYSVYWMSCVDLANFYNFNSGMRMRSMMLGTSSYTRMRRRSTTGNYSSNMFQNVAPKS